VDAEDWYKNRRDWECTCGLTPKGFSPNWKWTGKTWQHYHRSIGFVDTKRKVVRTEMEHEKLQVMKVKRLFLGGKHDGEWIEMDTRESEKLIHGSKYNLVMINTSDCGVKVMVDDKLNHGYILVKLLAGYKEA